MDIFLQYLLIYLSEYYEHLLINNDVNKIQNLSSVIDDIEKEIQRIENFTLKN